MLVDQDGRMTIDVLGDLGVRAAAEHGTGSGVGVKEQYCSLKDLDLILDLGLGGRRKLSWSYWPFAHLSFDAPWLASATTANNFLLE